MNSVEIIYRYAADDLADRARPGDGDAARLRLDDGNRAFASLLNDLAVARAPVRRVVPIAAADLGLVSGDAPAQRPYAAVLGCSDARVPIELIFGEGPNDLFVVRVAGNVLGTDVLASLKYAADHLGDSLKLVVVLGHSGCGAVTAAVDVFLDPSAYLALATQPMLRGLLDRLIVVVHASATGLAAAHGAAVTARPGYRAALIEAAAAANAAVGAYTIREQLDRAGRPMQSAFGVYVLATRAVWSPAGEGGEASGLAEPPTDRDGFAALARAIAHAPRIVSLLDTTP